jgi:hypothetical protein
MTAINEPLKILDGFIQHHEDNYWCMSLYPGDTQSQMRNDISFDTALQDSE